MSPRNSSDPEWLVGRMESGPAAIEVRVIKLQHRVQIAFEIPGQPEPLRFKLMPHHAVEIAKMLQAGGDFFRT